MGIGAPLDASGRIDYAWLGQPDQAASGDKWSCAGGCSSHFCIGLIVRLGYCDERDKAVGRIRPD